MFNQRPLFGAPVRKPGWPLDGSLPAPNGGESYPMDEQPITALPNPGSIFAGANPAIRKPTAFEPGGIGRNIIGGLGDALATWSGGQANFHDGQMMKQKQAFAQAEADRQRAAEFADWTKKQDYEAAHPKPANNDTVNDYDFIASKLGPEAAEKYLRSVAAGPPIPVRNADGTYNLLSRGDIGSSTAPSPPATLPPDFDFGGSAPTTGSMGVPSNAVSPGGSTPTTLSRADAAPFLKPLGPAGFQRWMAAHNIRLGN